MDASRARVRLLESRSAELEESAAAAPAVPSFADALRGATVTVIAEVKRSSPSKGAIAPALDAALQAAAYARGGAAACSILTEPSRFGGSLDDLRGAVGAGVPLLRKDFIVSRLQLLEARAAGASAALLIVRALSPAELDRLAADAAEIGLDVLAEVRDEAELARAVDCGAPVIGVNNRNLETLRIDPETSVRLVPRIPPDRVGVAESGIGGRADVERFAAVGADAVLVGSLVSAAPDPAAAVAGLVGVSRVRRSG